MFIQCLNMEIETKLRKWGNSYGVLLPKEVVENQNLKEDSIVKINISPKKPDFRKLFGLCKFKKPMKEIIKEIKEGHDQEW